MPYVSWNIAISKEAFIIKSHVEELLYSGRQRASMGWSIQFYIHGESLPCEYLIEQKMQN